MTTKTVTRKMIVAALKKDVAILEKQLKATHDYIKLGCGHFLNVGNDNWCGGQKEVLRFYKNVVQLGNTWLKRVESAKTDDVVSKIYIPDNWAGESGRLVFGEADLSYPDCFPNLRKCLSSNL